MDSNLAQLSEAVLDIALISLILGIVSALLMLMIHELLLLRAAVHIVLLRLWGPLELTYGEVVHFGFEPEYNKLRAAGLPYRQLCGQMLAYATAWISRRAEERYGEQAYEIAQDQTQDAEAYVNALQTYLGASWLRINYVLSFALAVGIVTLIERSPDTIDTAFLGDPSLTMLIAGVAAIIAPLVLQLLERYFSSR